MDELSIELTRSVFASYKQDCSQSLLPTESSMSFSLDKSSFLTALAESHESSFATAGNSRAERLQKYKESLRRKGRRIRSLEQALSRGMSLDMKQHELLSSKHDIFLRLNMLQHFLKTDKEISSEPKRYLCISNGCMVYCLDLNRNIEKPKIKVCSYELEPLPMISSLVLLNLGYPVSMGLFKLGCDAYMIGGHMLSSRVDFSDLSCDIMKLYYGQNTFEGKPSLVAYSLSLNNGSLSLSSSHTIKPLKRPKICPMVEKIGSQLHVIDSFPASRDSICPRAIFSHEVLDTHNLDRGWTCNSHLRCTTGAPNDYIWYSLVIGDRIYSRRDLYRYGVFDTTTQKWEWYEYQNIDCFPHLYSIKHVAQLIVIGYGRCIGELTHGGSSFVPPLYVVIGVGPDENNLCNAAAYIVTPTGQVLCYQRLPYLFKEFARNFHRTLNGTVTRVDDKRECYCAIVVGMTFSPAQELLFVSMFTVEYSLWVQRPLPHRILSRKVADSDKYDIHMLPDVLEEEFVMLFVTDWHAYDFEDHESGRWSPHPLTACFLD